MSWIAERDWTVLEQCENSRVLRLRGDKEPLTCDRGGRALLYRRHLLPVTFTRQQHNRHRNIADRRDRDRDIRKKKRKKKFIGRLHERARGITATTTRRPRFRLQRRSRISSRADEDEDEKFPWDFHGDNAPGRKDNAPGNTGREGHDYPLLFLPTGCRGVTPDGIYEAARKATDEI